MLFEVAINTDIYVYEQYTDMLEAVREALSQWNNFYPEQPMSIILRKIRSDTPTLGIVTSDESTSTERIS